MELPLSYINPLQEKLNFAGCKNKQFIGPIAVGKIGVTGFAIGLVGGLHMGFLVALIAVYFMGEQWVADHSWFYPVMLRWCTYITLLCSFHFGEFLSTALFQSAKLSYDSYIVNHSKSYTVAVILSFIEYWLESFLFGNSSKFSGFISFVGVLLVLGGQVVRSVAMCQCGENFSHIIMDEKDERHRLVTTGIYKYLRHPSYFGWFYWSVGTQLILCNPLCTILYAVTSWVFFKERIAYEESTLLRFYGREYQHYMQTTKVGIPFLPASSTNIPGDLNDLLLDDDNK